MTAVAMLGAGIVDRALAERRDGAHQPDPGPGAPMTLAHARATLAAAVLAACTAAAPAAESDLEAAVVAVCGQGWSRGDVSVFDSTVADSVRFHYAGSSLEMSRDDMTAGVLRWREAFPDLRMTVEETIREDDLVAARLTLSGTHEGLWDGAEPTGARVRMALMMFFRFEDGRAAELWESDDRLGLHRQLGLLP